MKEESFTYTYSAKQQEEVNQIRQKYLPKEEDKLEQLRRLDRGVTRKGTMQSIIVGTLGALVLGIGMSCCMVWTDTLLVPGIVIGIAGMIGVGLAYPIYRRTTKKEREKIAPQILKLAEELSGQAAERVE